MTPSAIVRQQHQNSARRDLLNELKSPTAEMIIAGYEDSDMAFISGRTIRKMFIRMIEQYEGKGL